MRELFHFYKNRPEWMREFYIQLKDVFTENKYMFSGIFGFIFLMGFLILSNHQGEKISDAISLQKKHDEIVLHELNEIKVYLQDVESSPFNTNQQQAILQSLEKDIVNAQKSIVDVAKVGDIKKVSSQIASVKDDFDSQMSDIKKAISQGVGKKEYLDKSVLPFHVISVDVIAGQPYVSIEYANHVSPLAVGDTLTGWRLAMADYESSMSEFVNEKNQYVKISL
jgi:hypothetical protein